MDLGIESRITNPVDKNSIVSIYGVLNKANIKDPISTQSSIGTITRARGTGIQNHGENLNDNSRSSSHLNHTRKRNQDHSSIIVRGQKWNVMTNGAAQSNIKFCLGWEVLDQRCDVDASAFMLCQNEKVPSDEWFVFYGQDTSPDNSVKYKSNQGNDSLPDDAELTIDLNKVRNDIQKILICATIYEPYRYNLNFGMVKNLYARILDDYDNELCYIPAVDLPSEVTSLVIGELYRYRDAWKFCNVSAGYKRDLAAFCNIYGVELE